MCSQALKLEIEEKLKRRIEIGSPFLRINGNGNGGINDFERMPDSLDKAQQCFSKELIFLTSKIEMEERSRASEALWKFKEGTYDGICQKCGEKIDDARLRCLPETPICRSCAKHVSNLF